MASVTNNTSYERGEQQAHRYREMLIAKAEEASRFPLSSSAVSEFPGLRSIFVRWRRAHNGHHVIFRPTEHGIEIVRVIHSSMDITSQLKTYHE